MNQLTFWTLAADITLFVVFGWWAAALAVAFTLLLLLIAHGPPRF